MHIRNAAGAGAFYMAPLFFSSLRAHICQAAMRGLIVDTWPSLKQYVTLKPPNNSRCRAAARRISAHNKKNRKTAHLALEMTLLCPNE